MYKIILIILLASFGVVGQDLGIVDSDTLKKPKTGLTRFSEKAGKLFFRGATGTKKEVVSTNNSYANPVWIPSIALAKVTGLQDSLNNTVKKIAGKSLSTNDFTNVYKTNVDANTTARHSHLNKVLLDTYTQTEANIADAVAKRHAHANQAVLDATTASFLSAEKTKLTGIATGATANSTDSQLRDRATHTGTQLSSTISDFSSSVVSSLPQLIDVSATPLFKGLRLSRQITLPSITTGIGLYNVGGNLVVKDSVGTKTVPYLENTNTFTGNENYFKTVNISENSNSHLKLGQFSVAYPNALIDATTSLSGIVLRTQGIDRFKLFNNGNLVLQNGGTFVDEGAALQVKGSSKFSGASVFSKGSSGEIIRLSGAPEGYIYYTVSGNENFIHTGANMTFNGTNYSTIYTDRYGVFSRFSPSAVTSSIAYQIGLLDTGTNPRTPTYPFTLLNNGNVGIGTASPTSKFHVSNGNIETDNSTNGLILKSPDGTRYLIKVANGGTLTATAL